MEELACPCCKTTKYRDPSLKLMINICGHTLCESCVDMLFLKGSGSCPQCGVPLRRHNFRKQIFEDPMVEKEVDIRKRVLRDYNKREENFETLKEYNDYLEEIEHLVHNLVHDIDIMETNKRIDDYKRDNREIIKRNKGHLGKEDYELQEIVDLEHAQMMARKRQLELLQLERKKQKVRTQEEFIYALTFSEKETSEIVNEFVETMVKNREEETQIPPTKVITEFSTGIKIGRTADSNNLLADMKGKEGPFFVYAPPAENPDGPAPPTMNEIQSDGFLTHIRKEKPIERAGGFESSVACYKAMQEAYQSMFYKIPIDKFADNPIEQHQKPNT